MMWKRLLAGLLFSMPLMAVAADDLEAPPPPPDSVEKDPGGIVDPAEADQFKPEVTIIRREHEVVEEYRINGQLYKVKVTPTKGKPYYLLYPHGPQGAPIRRDIDDLRTPYWVIFSW